VPSPDPPECPPPNWQGRAVVPSKCPWPAAEGKEEQGKLPSKSPGVLHARLPCGKRQSVCGWRSGPDFGVRRRGVRDMALILAGLPWLQAGKLILGYKQVA